MKRFPWCLFSQWILPKFKNNNQQKAGFQLYHKYFSNSVHYDKTFTSRRMGQIQSRLEEDLFNMFKNEQSGLLPIGNFLNVLKTTGIKKCDPRLKHVMENLQKFRKKAQSKETPSDRQNLDLETFTRIISPSTNLIMQALKQELIISDFPSFSKNIEEIYWRCKDNNNGRVANYIPQLSKANPDNWGVSICTIDGQRYSIGDVNVPFTLQSCSKPLTYAIALDELGEETVHQFVGQEPSGRNFNELILDHNKKPHNPMINAGAIIVCSLLKTLIEPDLTLAEKFELTLNYFKRLAGGESLGFNNAIFLSEREAADRNYALGFLLKEYKCYPEYTNFKDCMDFYFQCCAMEGNCEIVSIIAATLANGGICPLTEEKVLKPESVRNVLSLMHSCGMYDYSGQFAFTVGLPAKSGVCGGLMVVVPNVMGICTWSPPLDPLGNSCRGVQFCQELVKKFNFHHYDTLRYATGKLDPRRRKFETKAQAIVRLLFAAANGDLPSLRGNKLSGMDMNLSDYDGRTALHLAASEGHVACVEFLLKHCNVPFKEKDRWGNTPLDGAFSFGRMEVVELLQKWSQISGRNDQDKKI